MVVLLGVFPEMHTIVLHELEDLGVVIERAGNLRVLREG